MAFHSSSFFSLPFYFSFSLFFFYYFFFPLVVRRVLECDTQLVYKDAVCSRVVMLLRCPVPSARDGCGSECHPGPHSAGTHIHRLQTTVACCLSHTQHEKAVTHLPCHTSTSTECFAEHPFEPECISSGWDLLTEHSAYHTCHLSHVFLQKNRRTIAEAQSLYAITQA